MVSTVELLLRHRVALILTIAGAVDVLTGDPAGHGLALVAVAVALFAEHGSERRGDAADVLVARARFRVTTPMAVGAVAYAAVVGTFARFSWPLTLAVVAPGAAAVAFAWRGTPPTGSTTGDAVAPSAVPWIVVLLALAAWEVQALLLQPTLTTSSWAHPTLSTLMDSVLSSYVGRAVSSVAWLALGGYLLER